MIKKALGDNERHRAAGRQLAAAKANPFELDQLIDCATADRDAADFLDLSARDRLVVGDDRQGLDRGAADSLRVSTALSGASGTPRSGAVRKAQPSPILHQRARRALS